MNDNNDFAKRLRKLLQQARLSQQNVADALDIPRNTVWRWINGKATPESSNMQNLANLLNISVDELLNPHAQDNKSWVLQIKIADDITQEVIDMAKNVPTVSSITTTPAGGFLCLGGDYSLWTDDNAFKKIIADLKKFRNTVIQNGIALGGIKQ